MNKNEMTTNELNLMLIEANENTNGAFENIVKYESDIFWCDLEIQDLTHEEVINMVWYGNYKPYHEYIGFDGYGNIESMTEEDYRQELLDYYEEYSEEV